MFGYNILAESSATTSETILKLAMYGSILLIVFTTNDGRMTHEKKIQS